MKSIFKILIFSIILTSCKNDENKNSIEKESIQNKPFTVEIQMIVKEDDVICLYYKDLSISYFTEEMAIYKNLKKSSSTQTIIFELPESFVPNDFRFDLSCQNKNQEIYVERMIFTFKDENFVILNEDIDKYLQPNEGVEFNLSSRVYTFKEVKGAYDPFLTTTGQFFPLLEPLVGYEAFPRNAN